MVYLIGRPERQQNYDFTAISGYIQHIYVLFRDSLPIKKVVRNKQNHIFSSVRIAIL